MIRLAVRTLVFLGSSAIGLLVAGALVDGVEVTATGFLITVTVFAVIQTVITPFIARVAARNAHALLGGVGLISTLVALVAATLFGDSLDITGGLVTWIAATVVVWLATAVATLLLPIVLLRIGRELQAERGDRGGPAGER